MNATQNEEDIFLAALEIDLPAGRAAYLDEACGENAGLRCRVEKLLLRHQESGGILDAPPPGIDSTNRIATVSEKPGALIGPYKLLEQIGEGGFGVVFLAEQERPVRRRVALKIIKPGMDTRQVIARFEAERQALAMMDHPDIAKVLEAGATESGRPYFVMELVQGVPITEYCDQCNLTTRERLELFLSVCLAVQHAHQKGVIHRDLKPTNVLVAMQDGQPAPKIIDFGIAKAINQRLSEQTLMTGFAQMLGTPLYMSPEQAELSPLGVDTRSDIYSLGVLLYELLTGTTPFDKDRLHAASYDELRRIIREEEPPRPSARISTLAANAVTTVADQRRTDARRLSNTIRGDLDWIVMKCLEKDRNRRYETASALATDIQRYLSDEPIEARPPSAVYRFRKFALRHKARIALTIAIAVTASTGLGFAGALKLQRDRHLSELAYSVRESLAAARTAVQAEDLPLAQQRLAEAESRMLAYEEVLPEIANPVQGFRRELNARVAELDRFHRFVNLDEDDIFDPHDSSDQSAAWLKAREGLAIYGLLEHDDWAARLETTFLSSNQRDQVRDQAYKLILHLADYCVRWDRDATTKESVSGEQAARQGLELLEKALVFQEATPAVFHLRRKCWKKLGNTESAADDEQHMKNTPARFALDHFLPGRDAAWDGDKEEAVRRFQEALRVDPKHYFSLFFMGVYLSNDLSRPAEAIMAYNGCLAVRPDAVGARLNRGSVYGKLKKFDEALYDYNRAIEVDPNSSAVYRARGYTYQLLGRNEDALRDYDKAIELDPDGSDELTADAYNNRGAIFAESSKLDLAIADFSKAIELNPNDHEFFRARAMTYGKLGKYSDALADANKAIELNRENFLHYYCRAQDALVPLKEYGKAIDDLRHSLELALKIPQSDEHKLDIAMIHQRRAECFVAIGEYESALADYTKRCEILPQYGAVHTDRGYLLVNNLGRYRDAAKEAEMSISPPAEIITQDQFYNAACLYALASVQVAKDESEPDRERTARQYADRAVELLKVAIEKGIKDFEHIRNDSDLDSIRQHPQFPTSTSSGVVVAPKEK